MNKYKEEYCNENGIKTKKFNKYNINNYTYFLEKKLEAINNTGCSLELPSKEDVSVFMCEQIDSLYGEEEFSLKRNYVNGYRDLYRYIDNRVRENESKAIT